MKGLSILRKLLVFFKEARLSINLIEEEEKDLSP